MYVTRDFKPYTVVERNNVYIVIYYLSLYNKWYIHYYMMNVAKKEDTHPPIQRRPVAEEAE